MGSLKPTKLTSAAKERASVVVVPQEKRLKVDSLFYTHGTVRHAAGQYADGPIHTNTIEGFWSQFKRSVHGTYHKVSPKHLQTYLDEFSYRYAHRFESLPRLLFAAVGRTFARA